MAKAKENLRIEVTQSTADDLRSITVTIAAPAKDFLLPDLLTQRGVLSPFEVTLKQAVREATERYLAGTEDLIAGLAAGQKQAQKAEAPAQKPKLNGNGKGVKSAASKREAAATEKPAMLPEAEPISAAAALSAAGD